MHSGPSGLPSRTNGGHFGSGELQDAHSCTQKPTARQRGLTSLLGEGQVFAVMGSREAEFRVDSSSDMIWTAELRHEPLGEALVGLPFAFSSNSRHLVCASLNQPPLTATR